MTRKWIAGLLLALATTATPALAQEASPTPPAAAAATTTEPATSAEAAPEDACVKRTPVRSAIKKAKAATVETARDLKCRRGKLLNRLRNHRNCCCEASVPAA